MFEGFRSRWIIPLPCACFKPLARSKIIEAASSTPIGLGTSSRLLSQSSISRYGIGSATSLPSLIRAALNTLANPPSPMYSISEQKGSSSAGKKACAFLSPSLFFLFLLCWLSNIQHEKILCTVFFTLSVFISCF